MDAGDEMPAAASTDDGVGDDRADDGHDDADDDLREPALHMLTMPATRGRNMDFTDCRHGSAPSDSQLRSTLQGCNCIAIGRLFP
jgi:hypothetical protein